MLKEKGKVVIDDIKEKNKVEVDVNLFTDHPEWVQLTINGEKSIVTIDDLYSLVLVLCDPAQQENLIPVEQVEVMQYERDLFIKAKQNFKKGDLIKVRYKVDIPTTVVQGLAGLIGKKNHGIPLVKGRG